MQLLLYPFDDQFALMWSCVGDHNGIIKHTYSTCINASFKDQVVKVRKVWDRPSNI